MRKEITFPNTLLTESNINGWIIITTLVFLVFFKIEKQILKVIYILTHKRPTV